MPGSSNEPRNLEDDRRRDDQLKTMSDALGDEAFGSFEGDDPDERYLYVPEQVLVAEGDADPMNNLVNGRQDIFEGEALLLESPTQGLRLYQLPPSRARADGKADVEEALQLFDDDDDLGPGRVTPNHLLHVAAGGAGRACPATEPEETGHTDHWPPMTTWTGAGEDVRVVVVDTGEYPNPALTRPSTTIQAYDGHGLFVASIIEDRAPDASITPLWMTSAGGAIRESDIVAQLFASFDDKGPDQRPHIINLSAGCHTRRNLGLRGFRRLWNTVLKHPTDPSLRDTIVVAAAGNDGSSRPFFPAAYGWVLGVGSIDRNNAVSSFSNYGRSADVYALGRNHVNRYPTGRYVCREAPNKGDIRHFHNGLARWSGTSFAAPLVAGLIAARKSHDKVPTIEAQRLVLKDAVKGRDAVHGRYRYLRRSTYLPAYPR